MAGERPKGWKLLKAALATRKSATMLAFGFSSGLPFALLIGTLNAWLGDAKINLATIGVLSWIGLSLRVQVPVVAAGRPGEACRSSDELGRRKSWIVLCQAVLIAAFVGLGASDPATQHRHVRDFRGDRRLRVGDAGHRGRRLADRRRRRANAGRAALGGLPVRLSHRLDRRRRALRLLLAARMQWGTVYLIMAGLVVLLMVVAAAPRPTPSGRRRESSSRRSSRRASSSRACGSRRSPSSALCWLWAIVTLATLHGRRCWRARRRARSRLRWPISPRMSGRGSSSRRCSCPLVVAAVVNWLQGARARRSARGAPAASRAAAAR